MSTIKDEKPFLILDMCISASVSLEGKSVRGQKCKRVSTDRRKGPKELIGFNVAYIESSCFVRSYYNTNIFIDLDAVHVTVSYR